MRRARPLFVPAALGLLVACGGTNVGVEFTFPDAAEPDATPDAAEPDAAALDASDLDATAPDAAALDAAALDATAPDAAALDASALDATAPDAAALDATALDATAFDATALDAAAPDAGPASNATSSWSAAAGLPDIACPSWTIVDTANPEAPSVSGGVLTVRDDQLAENMYFVQSGAQLIAPPRLIIEARMRYVSGGASTPSRAPAVLAFRLGAGLDKQLLHIGDGEVFLLSGENTRGSSTTTPTADAFHDYRLEADLPGGAVRAFRDGRLILSGQVYPEPSAGAAPAIFFGEGSLFAYGTSEWVSFSHNAHAPTACP